MRKMPLLLAVWAAFVPPVAASAASITVQFTGIVTQVPIDDIYGDITAGSLFAGSYTFNSTAVDLIPADPASGSYTSSGVPFEMLVSIDGHVFTASDSVNIGIFNSFVDQYTVLALGASGDLALELFLQDNAATVFANDGLPLTAPLLGAFAIKDFHSHQVAVGGEVQVDGQVTSLSVSTVPEPSAGLLVCAGLVVLLLLWRRKDLFKSQSGSRRSIKCCTFNRAA
jgi:hypothetical protein